MSQEYRKRGGDGKLPSLFDAFDAERAVSQVVSHWREYISIVKFHGRLFTTSEAVLLLGISRQRLHKLNDNLLCECRFHLYVPNVGWRWVWSKRGLTKRLGKQRLSIAIKGFNPAKVAGS